jgi:hypothetical protein
MLSLWSLAGGMSFEAINGLRILAGEVAPLCSLTIAASLVTRSAFSGLSRRAWLRKILEENSRAVLLVVAVAAS